MMPINQNYVVLIVSVLVLLFCYYLFRESRRTQNDVQGLQAFSAKIMQSFEAKQQASALRVVQPPTVHFADPPVEEEVLETADSTEGKKED